MAARIKIKDLDSGKLNRFMTIKKPVSTVDEIGGRNTPTWTKVIDIWAYIIPWSGRESMFAGLNRATTTHLIYSRWFNPANTVIDASMRIEYGARVLNIKAAFDMEEAHRFFEFECVEGVPT